jgi:hypothetical protein
MTLKEAREQAEIDAVKYSTDIVIVHDPTSSEDWETTEEAYQFCAPEAVDLMFGPGLRAGLAKRIETIKPKGDNEQ